MKKTIFYLFIFSCLLLHSQQNENDYFYLYKDGEKYLKPIKYIKYNPEKNSKKISNNYIYFYIEGERFKFSKNKHLLDTCKINNLKKINFSKVNELVNEEFEFYKQKIKESNYWKNKKTKPPIPVKKIHPFFKIFIVEKYQSKILKYEVDWENSHSY